MTYAFTLYDATTLKAAGKRVKTDGEQPPNHRLHSVGCINKERCDYITLELDVSTEDKLYFLVDSGADTSLVKSKKMLGMVELEPRD
jgi:hypothetical protein